jgi:hypothetical protein
LEIEPLRRLGTAIIPARRETPPIPPRQLRRRIMIYDYNLVVALITGKLGGQSRKTIKNDISLVMTSVRKHQVYAPKPGDDDAESDDEEAIDAAMDDEDVINYRDETADLVAGGVVQKISLTPEKLKLGIKPKWKKRFQRLNEARRSRLVLFAHGDHSTTKMAAKTGDAMAKLLVNDFGLRRVTRISVLACIAGGDGQPSVGCFAHEFHTYLARPLGVYTEVTARTGLVRSAQVDVNNLHAAGRREVWFPNAPGATPKSGNGEWRHRAPGSKYLWYWAKGQQMVKGLLY